MEQTQQFACVYTASVITLINKLSLLTNYSSVHCIAVFSCAYANLDNTKIEVKDTLFCIAV